MKKYQSVHLQKTESSKGLNYGRVSSFLVALSRRGRSLSNLNLNKASKASLVMLDEQRLVWVKLYKTS